MSAWRTTAIVVAIAVAIGSPAAADVSASRKCRSLIGTNMTKVVKSGLKAADACHKTADKACDPTGPCNDPTNGRFDPLGKYVSTKTKATAGIDAGCLAGDPVLTNYDGMNAENAVFPKIDEAVGGNSALVVGGADLDCDKAKTKCIEAIAKNRSKVLNAIVKASTKCQAGLDKTATSFGAIDPSCIDDGAAAIAKAGPAISKGCTGLTSIDVGSCDPLPDCATDAAKLAGQQLVRDIYSVPPPPAVCGNGTIESPEQCDDGNTTDGDGCNHLCEAEYSTCTPPSSPNAHRMVTVSIDTPVPLAGVRVDLSYPIFEAGLPGFGDSSVVRSRVNILQPGGLSVVNDTDLTFVTVSLASANEFISTGDLFTVDFDNCVPLAENICNRSKNVIGCSLNPTRCTCTANADCGPGGTCTLLGGVIKECTAGDASRQSCTSDADCEASTSQTCQPDPSGFSDPPLCKPGHFPQLVDNVPPYVVGTEIGPCDGTSSGPPGGCPGDNVCLPQTEATSCSLSDPVDHNGNHVDGVTCAVTIVEQP